MPNSVDFGGRPFHFIGIGGIGMSALAYVLTRQHLPVSGSDMKLSHITQRLQDAGAHVFWRQEAQNLQFFASEAANPADSAIREPLPQVICSTAIDSSNPEYKAALSLGCPIFHRSELLAALIKDYAAIAVAGTHGKTTTSSMIGVLLLEANLDPTIVVGGEVEVLQGNARLGEGPYLVAEADESDGSLSKLSAEIGVVTNIELDHTDHYQTLQDVVETFRQFAGQCQEVVGCIDCATVREELKPSITYSLHPESEADYTADDIYYDATGTTATVWERGERLGRLRLAVLGQHNLSNALAAVAVGRQLGLPFDRIANILARFQGARRRFELLGHYNGIRFVDDYAHHPSEIRATLAAARLKLQKQESGSDQTKRIVAIFQPHRYSRAATLLRDFADAFEDADHVIVTDIYSAGEQNCYGISGAQIADEISARHARTEYLGHLESVQDYLARALEPGDLAIFLGAGNLNQIIPQIMAEFSEKRVQSLSQACR